MQCASCGHANPAGSRFCSGCGAALAPRCPACDAENPVGARFCNHCGTALATPRPATDAVSRKIVTIVFADLIGSMSLHERLDAESARRVMDRYHRAMAAAVDVHGGRVVQLLGDGVLAAFGVPRVAEDDAIRAVRAAVGMQRAFRELAREQSAALGGVGLRVAVNTGEVVVSDDENSVMGDPTNVAARLQQEARDGDVIVGEGTQRLVGALVTLAPLGSFALRGRAESVAAYRVVSLDRPASAQAIAFVGREDELRRLVAVYDDAVATPAAKLAVLLGSPGLGKSRLVAEFTRRAGERATVLSARCDADGGATFAPLAGALRALLRIDEGAGGDVLRAAIDAVVSGDDAERTRIATGIGALLAGTPAPPEETFFVVRRLLAALAAVRPVVLVIDDLQWAEPLLLDLVEHLVQWSGGVPLLVLVAARPELRDARSALATSGGLVADVVTLAGLDAGAATRLAANVIGGSELPAALAGRVLATSEGNPLFVSELVRMLVQDGTLQREGDRWITTVEIAKLDMPPTIQVLLAARIERLRPEERSVLERAAVVGRQFSRAAVAQLLPREVHDLDARLEALRRSELIEPDTGWFLGEPALRFHHVLIRDAAYRRVLKETRAELHARIADWIIARVGDAIEHDETIGWHLEQAHQYLRELGSMDENARSLGERAARHLGAAGRRALARDDLPLAAGLLGRALERLDPADVARANLALDWCEALLAAGDVVPAVAAIGELGRFCADAPRLRAWHVCFTGQLAVLTDPQALRTTADAVASAADELAAIGDEAGEAKAHFVHAMALVRLGKIGACETALDRALAAARRARDRRRANAVLAGAPVAALWGPSPVTRASGRCLDVVRVLRITQGAPAVEAVALRCQGVLEALRGRTDAARRMVASSRRLVEELGITQRLLEADVFAGHVELIEGDAEAAERWLRTAYDGLRNLGLGIDAAQAGALLGRALLAQDRASEAEALSHESEALAGDDLKAAITWRGVRAEALARRGEHAAAITFAQAAVEIAAATDDLLDHADARQSLAVALRAAGRGDEADAEQMRAIELWEAKGATLLVDRARDRSGAAVESRSRADPSRHSWRHVRSNRATEHVRRLDAAVAARDYDAFARLVAPDLEVVHHPTGASYGHGTAVERFRTVLQDAESLSFQHEPVATLGEALALCRATTSSGGATFGDFEAGAFEIEYFAVIESDAAYRSTRVEVFGADHLADAIARLYERYAELLHEGPERERAAATARALAVLSDPTRFTAALEPGVAAIDHRTVGFGALRGADDATHAVRALLELGDDNVWRFDDVLGLRSDALLLRSTDGGTGRTGGGAFERSLCQLWIFGAQGLVTRWEQFDAEQEAEAFARFDELTGGARPSVARRPVRPNFASEVTRRLNAAIAARDVSALPELWAEDAAIFHHPTGLTYGRDAAVGRFRAGFEDTTGLSVEHVSIATLGASLGLARMNASMTGVVSDGQSFGAVELHGITLTEANERSQAVRVEIFADDHLADAIVRLYERHAELLPDGAERTRAQRTARSIAALLGPFDLEACATAIAADVVATDHRRMGLGSGTGAAALLRGFATAAEISSDLAVRVDDVIAATPDTLLVRWTTAGTDRTSGGRFEWQFLRLFHFGSQGLLTHYDTFESDREADALARFDALTAAAPEPHFANEASRAQLAFERSWRERDWDGVIASLRPDVVLDDRRSLVGVRLRGGEFLANLRMLFETASSEWRSELLATRGERLALFRSLFRGEVGGGGLEDEHLSLVERDASGRAVVIAVFDPGAREAAQAELDRRFAAGEGTPQATLLANLEAFRVDAASAEPDARHAQQSREPAAHIQNVVTRSETAFQRAWETRDWDALAALVPAHFRSIDRRPLLRLEVDRETMLRGIRPFFEMDIARSQELVATRGERLALYRVRFHGSNGESGPSDVEVLQLIEADTNGERSVSVAFDPEDRDGAFAELDARYAAGEAADERRATVTRAFSSAFAARDWDALAALLAPDLVVHDHRLLGWETLHGPAAYVQALQTLVDLAPDARLRIDHVSIAAPRFLYVTTWVGTREGGAFETPSVIVAEIDAQGRIRRFDQYDIDRLDEIRAGFAPLAPPNRATAASDRADAAFGTLRIPPNAATRAGDRVRECALAADWDALRDLCAPTVFDDRRKLFRMSGGCEMFVANTQAIDRSIWESSIRTLLATAGDRLALHRNQWRGGGVGSAFEVDTLELTEVDDEGRVVAAIVFDPEDRRGAGAELIERYVSGGGLRIASRAEMTRAIRDHDLDRLRATLPGDFVFHDHRRVGAGRLEGEAYVAWLAGLFEQSPDALIEPLYVIVEEPHAVLSVGHTFGTRVEGGAFESVFVQLATASALEIFELDDLDRARARFEEMRPDPLRIPPNAATRAMDRLGEARNASDWDAMEALCAPSMTFDDRRRAALLRGDRAMFLASARVVASYETQITPTLLATTGDRLALRRLHFAGSAGGGAVEADALSLVEVDGEGRVVAIIAFDLDDRRAASLEMMERFARSDEAPPFFASQFALMRGLIEHDLEPLRAALPANFYLDDRRHAGMGRIDGAPVFIESFAALFEQSADLVFEGLYTVAIRPHGMLEMAHMFGTVNASGGDFESFYLRLFVFDANGPVGLELFEPEDLDAARARLDALHSDAAQQAPNAASRVSARVGAIFASEDWQRAVRALASPAFRFEDRRRRALVDGDIEVWIRNLEVVRTWPDRRTRRTLLATLGERIEIEHIHYEGDAEGASYEGEFLRVMDVDGDGLLQAVLHFDVGDRALAFEEAQRRFANGEGNEPA